MMGSDGGMLFGSVFMWLFWLIVIALLVFAIKAIMGGG